MSTGRRLSILAEEDDDPMLSAVNLVDVFLVLVVALEGGRPADAGPARAAGSRLPQLELFRSPWLFPFAVFAAMLAFNALNLYLLNSWLPTVLPGAGLSLDAAAQVAGVANLAGLAIGVVFSVLVDRWRKGLSLMLMFGLMAASFAAIGLAAPDPVRWTLLLMVGVGGAMTGMFGLAFIGIELYEFAHMIHLGATPQRSAFLSSFFTLVGTHGLHVAFGLIWLVTLMTQVARHGLIEANRRRLMCLSMFWHFLDVVWIGVFTFVYLMGVLK